MGIGKEGRRTSLEMQGKADRVKSIDMKRERKGRTASECEKSRQGTARWLWSAQMIDLITNDVVADKIGRVEPEDSWGWSRLLD